ncbi:Iron-sulfur cluster assembly 1-like protein, mitochondrial [Plecturocebus cupreus]
MSCRATPGASDEYPPQRYPIQSVKEPDTGDGLLLGLSIPAAVCPGRVGAGHNEKVQAKNIQRQGDSDEEVIQDGVRVFIGKKAQLTLLGTAMDYVEDKLSSEFVFNNPDIKGTCGCGESFNI